MRATHCVLAAVIALACCAAIYLWTRKPETAARVDGDRDPSIDEGHPYGQITDADVDRLQYLQHKTAST